MLDFTSEDYTFTIDGVRHTLPELNIDAFEKIAELYEFTDPIKQVPAFRDFMIEMAETDEAKTAIRKLGFRKVGELFRDWSGIGAKPGEAEPSGAK